MRNRPPKQKRSIQSHHFASILLASLLGLSISSIASAQGLYRCGNTYQDSPCSNGTGKKISGASNADPTGNKPKVLINARPVPDPACIVRGQDAQKIVWAREGGLIEEQMLAKAKSPAEKRLVTEVYSFRGTGSEVKSAIETACMEEKLAHSRIVNPTLDAIGGAEVAGASSAANAANASSASSKAESADKKRSCDQLRNQLESVLGASKKASSPEAESQRKELENSVRKMGC